MQPKFICVSVNPAIDKRVCLAGSLAPGKVNRATHVEPHPGGKAAHVAMVLKALGAEPLWIGLCGGASGQELTLGLQQLGIQTSSIPAKQPTRVNLEIIDGSHVVTEILEPGAPPTREELESFKAACQSAFEHGGPSTIVILSGSLPLGVPHDFYARLIQRAHANQCKVFLDTSGDALLEALAAHPDFAKPNREEAELLTGRAVSDPSSAAIALRQLLTFGAKSVAISLGDKGLVWCPSASQSIFFAHPLKVSVRSTVGCGDATLAAFAFAASSAFAPEESLRLAAACGAANCLAEAPGRVTSSVIHDLSKESRLEIIT